MPLEMLAGSPFSNYLLPGLILCIVLGLGAFFVLACLFTRPDWGWARAAQPVQDPALDVGRVRQLSASR